MEKIVAEFGPSSQISLRMTSLRTILATRLAPRVLLPALTKCYSSVANTWKVRSVVILKHCDEKESIRETSSAKLGSAVLAVSPPNLLPTTSLYSLGQQSEKQSLNGVQALFSSS